MLCKDEEFQDGDRASRQTKGSSFVSRVFRLPRSHALAVPHHGSCFWLCRRPISIITESLSDNDDCCTLCERPGTTQPARQDRLPKPRQCNVCLGFLLPPSPAHYWAPTSPQPSVSPAETSVVSRTHYRNRRDGP